MNIKTKLQFLFTGLVTTGLIWVQPTASSTVVAEYAMLIDLPANVRLVSLLLKTINFQLFTNY